MDSFERQLSLLSQAAEEAKEFCGAQVTDCFDCDRAENCPILNELFLKYFKKNGVNHYESKTKGTIHPHNTLNELTGAEWLYFTKTLLTTSYSRKYGHEIRKVHGANKPPELMKYLIEFFTKGSDRVLDPFAGVGGTLLGAAIAKPPRECIGVEINPRWVEIYEKVIETCKSQGDNLHKYELIQGDSLEILKTFDDGYFQFIAMDPPYNLHLAKTMCNGQYKNFANRKTDYDMYSEDPRDLANLSSYEDYLNTMECILGQCFRVLEYQKYMAIIIRNAYQDGEYIFTHADIAKRAKRAGFIAKGEIIWYEAGTRLRPYGYPCAYVPNIAHQYILIFQKVNKKGKRTVEKELIHPKNVT